MADFGLFTRPSVLVLLEIPFPFIHDLDRLRDLAPEGWRFKNDYPELGDLSIWAVEARYPADMPDVTESDAKEAIEKAQAIYHSIAEEITKAIHEIEQQ